MKILLQCLAVGGGGFVGALARFAVGSVCGRLFLTSFPIGTFIVNITGSLFLGWFLAFAGQRIALSGTIQLAIATGFVGAYTTFSTFMVESNGLIDDGAHIMGAINLIGSLVLGLAAVRCGIWLAAR